MNELSNAEIAMRQAAKKSLKYPAVSVTPVQAASLGKGLQEQCEKSGYSIWACAIMPEHAHLVIARHTYSVEQMSRLLKGSVTRRLIRDQLHPQAAFVEPGQPHPHLWSESLWKVFLNSEESIVSAIRYVEENPVEEGSPKQRWSFVVPFHGIMQSGWTTYHS